MTWQPSYEGFDFSRALIGLQVLAVARVALEETWGYIAQRQAFEKPLSAFQGVSHPLADLAHTHIAVTKNGSTRARSSALMTALPPKPTHV